MTKFFLFAMQIILFCMASFSGVQISLMFIGFLARPKRFELLTPRFVVWCLTPPPLDCAHNKLTVRLDVAPAQRPALAT
jgi:hypothetical protein